jgi:hypothetical protein
VPNQLVAVLILHSRKHRGKSLIGRLVGFVGHANARKMVIVMVEFGMGSIGFRWEDFVEPGIVNQIGQPPLRIDILNEIDGVTFAEAAGGRQFFKSGNLRIPFIGREDFIKNKKASGRKKDLADIRRITPKRGKKDQ